MLRPQELKSSEPLLWSPGTGVAVWNLFNACIDGDLISVQRQLNDDPTLVRCHHAYRTPLYFAVRENQIEIVDLLLQRGADPIADGHDESLVQISQDRGNSAMEQLLLTWLADNHGASQRGEQIALAIREYDVEKVCRLLDDSPDLLDAGDQRSNRPIHWATMTRQIELIDELLKRGADINSARSDGARPIQLTNGDYHYRGWSHVPEQVTVTPDEVLTHLRQKGAEIDICTAASIGDIDLVRQLLSHDAMLVNRVSDYVTYYVGSGSPIRNAASGGHVEIARLLLEFGADPNLREEGIAPHGQALYVAVTRGNHEMATLLLENGAIPNPVVESSGDALSRAIANDDERMIELLCSYGAAQSIDMLAYAGDIRTAAAAFDADPRLADDPDALSNAAGQGHESFVRLMLHYQPDLPSRISFPPWLVGAATRDLNELLFRHGLNPSQPDWQHVTPLHRFARNGDIDKAEIFIEHGAEIHARDEEICSTPLGWAAKYGTMSMVDLLLKHGASVNRSDDPPWATPLQWATRRGHHEVAERLRQRGAN